MRKLFTADRQKYSSERRLLSFAEKPDDKQANVEVEAGKMRKAVESLKDGPLNATVILERVHKLATVSEDKANDHVRNLVDFLDAADYKVPDEFKNKAA